jgi:hypothetical protein
MVEGTIYFCNKCKTYLRFLDHCKECTAAAAPVGWMVSNDTEV